MRLRFVTSITVLLMLLMMTFQAPAWADTAQFSDVSPSFWAANAIDTLVAKGVVHGFPGGKFLPGQSVTRAQFAAMVDTSLGLSPYQPTTPTFRDVPSNYWGFSAIETAFQAGIINGTGSGLFNPDAPITRQDMAVILVNALKLTNVAKDLVGQPISFADSASVSSYALGPVEAASRLGLMTGLPDGSFDPLGDATRAQAAQVIYNLLNLPAANSSELMASVARKIVLTVPSSSLALGNNMQITATIYDANGNVLPVTPAWSATGGTISPDGEFTAGQLGPATISASLSSGDNPIGAQAVIEVVGVPASAGTVTNQTSPSSQGTAPSGTPSQGSGGLSFTSNSFGPVTAGTSLNVTVQVTDAQGNVVTSDQGRSITVTAASPIYPNQTVTATDQDGVANLSIPVTLAGTFSLSAQSSGLSSTPSVSFQVVPGPPVGVQLFASPSVLVIPGQVTRIEAAVVDAYGNPTTASSSVNLTENTSALGVFTPVINKIQGGVTVLGNFTANGQVGTVTFTASQTTYGAASLTLDTYASAASLVAGKGMWLLYNDWENTSDSQIIATAQADGITHLYLEVATTSSGFYGQDGLTDLLPKLHAAHIALVAWIYSSLEDPGADAQLASEVATFTTSTGESPDALAVDMEENLTPANISAFSEGVRQVLGNSYPLIAVIYPPQSGPGQEYPSMYAAAAQGFNVLAPMDYWHSTPDAYTPQQAASYVTQSIQMIDSLSNNPTIPITIIGQAYNMFPSDSSALCSPSGAEESAAMQAAKSGGAVGYSMYRWGTATPDEWQAFGAMNW